MNDLNSVMIEGRLTRDPEKKETRGGAAVCNLSLAVNRYWKKEGEKQEETSFFDIVAFGRLAETCAEYLSKGRGARVVGRLKQDRWEQNGQNRSKVVIVAEHVEFKAEPKEQSRQAQPRQDENPDSREFMDDVPF